MDNTIRNTVKGIQHIGIPTNDLSKTTTFFEKLGFTVALRTETAREQVAFMRLGGITIEIYENGQAAGVPGAIDHLALDVSDIEEAYRAVRALGFEALEGEIRFLPFWDNGVRYFTIMGPEGEKVEYSQML